VTVPIRGQWEQQLNAFNIERYGIGLKAESFSAETFESALRHEAPPAAEIREWVAAGRHRLEAAVLGK
jgi:hypothetical protein